MHALSRYKLPCSSIFLWPLSSVLDFRLRNILVSFDIENMYPSIDRKEIMKIVNEKIKEKFGLNKISETLISTSNLVINEDHFIFHYIIYRQKKGLPMGSY